jgi:Protein of unknown function (DUF3124)
MSRAASATLMLLSLAAAACERDGEPAAGATSAVPADTGRTAATGSEAEVIAAALADTSGAGARQRLVYVPVYSQIHYRDERRLISLAVTLSIRNTDPQRPITLSLVRYYDTAGKALRGYVDAPVRLGPLQSTQYVVPDTDRSGGAGANFLVQWSADGPVTEPVIEAVMISTQSALGISFTSEGRTIQRR